MANPWSGQALLGKIVADSKATAKVKAHNPNAECDSTCKGVRESGFPCRCICHYRS